MGWLEGCFAGLPDPRTGNARRHDLAEVVTIALVASVRGAETCVDFADFARDREALFREFLRLGGPPSRDTFSRLFRLLDPAAFRACFGRFLDGLGEDGRGGGRDRRQDAAPLLRPGGRGLALARGDRLRDRGAARAWSGGRAAPGGSEITAARDLLGLLDLTGTLVTGDALHLQGETTALIEEKGGDWLFALKANHPATLAEVERFFADPANPVHPHHNECRPRPHRELAPLGPRHRL